MQRDRVVNSGADVCCRKISLDLFPAAQADHIKVVYRLSPRRLKREANLSCRRSKQVSVTEGAMAASLGPLVKAAQLGPQNPGLNCIQSAVVSLHLMMVLSRLAVVAKHSDLLGQDRIIGGDS